MAIRNASERKRAVAGTTGIKRKRASAGKNDSKQSDGAKAKKAGKQKRTATSSAAGDSPLLKNVSNSTPEDAWLELSWLEAEERTEAAPLDILRGEPSDDAVPRLMRPFLVRWALMKHYGKSNLADTIIAMLMETHNTTSLDEIAMAIGAELWQACKQPSRRGASPRGTEKHAQILFGMETLTGRLRDIAEMNETSTVDSKNLLSGHAAARQVSIAMYGNDQEGEGIWRIWNQSLRDDTPARRRALDYLFTPPSERGKKK